jgi:hypothetical protein
MIRGFNFKRYKLSQMNIDEETGEILEDQEPKPEDFHHEGFAHSKDVIDLGNVNDIHYLRSIGSPLPSMIEGYLYKPDSDRDPTVMRFGSKTLIIPPKVGLAYFISNNKLAKFAFMTSEQIQENEKRARDFVRKSTLSHTPRPRSATVQVGYSTETASCKGATDRRRIILSPKMESYLTSEESTSFDPKLTQMESQFTGFNADILRAIFDPNFNGSAAYKDGVLSKKDFAFIQMKRNLIKQLAKMSPMQRPSMREIAVALLKGLERKFEYDKVHSIEHDTSTDRWYPDDVEKMIARAIRAQESKSK